MQHLSHAELIAVLTEVWTLLDTLAIIKPGALKLPPSDTGLHPAGSFDADAALAAGFDPEAIALMSALPYLHVEPDMGQRAIEILGSTFPLSYLHYDEDDFRDIRELFFDDKNLIPSSAFRLTWHDVNGWEYIYDTKERLVYVWNPINDGSGDGLNYFHLRPVSPRQAFQPLIDSFRGLRRVAAAPEATPVGTDEDSGPQASQFQNAGHYEAGRRVWKAVCSIADLYVECGWDVNAEVQMDFRSGEFIEKRAKYVGEVVQPLKAQAYIIGQAARN